MRGNEYMLKSFHLGHVCEAHAEAFLQSKMKVVQASKIQAKEYSTAAKYSNEMRQSEDKSLRKPKSEP